MTDRPPLSRRNTRTVIAGSVSLGGGAPVAVQSMTNTDPHNPAATLQQISRLAAAGAELVRVAVPDAAAAEVLEQLCLQSTVPLVADIHFDHRLALAAIAAGVAKVRINPGNIGSRRRVREVASAARDAGVPIRIGVNAGSLPRDIREEYGVSARAMVETALREIGTLDDVGFSDVVLSLKASDVSTTVEANEQISGRVDIPLHLGVTEAGAKWRGTIKSSVGLGYLLGRGIGDTIRISLTGDPVDEVRTAWEILAAWGLRRRGPDIVSCPTCGRCRVNMAEIVEQVEQGLVDCSEPITVAVMGCEVNGPGEAREADVGLACGEGVGLLMRDGEVVEKVTEDEMVDSLLQLVRSYLTRDCPSP